MASLLSNLVNSLSEGIHNLNVNLNIILGMKNVKFDELNKSIVNLFLNTQISKMIYQNTNVYVVTKIMNKFDEKLKERLFNAYKFPKHNNNKFILLLRKGVYPYECMGDQEKFNETSLPKKEENVKEFVKTLK